MDIERNNANKATNGTIAAKLGRKKLERIGDLFTLYNRGNFFIDTVKAPFFTLTWVALLFDWLVRTFNFDISPKAPMFIAFLGIPLCVLVAWLDKKFLGIWQRQYYYELKKVNPYFEERFDTLQNKIDQLIKGQENNNK